MNTPEEDRMLAWIEGEMSPEESAAFEAEMARDASAYAKLRQARTDRAGLQLWGRAAASATPGDLVDDALGRAERRMLIGASADSSDSAYMNETDVIGSIGAPSQRVSRFAIAAIILLAASAGVTVLALRSTTPASRPAPLAEGPSTTMEDATSGSQLASADTAMEEAPGTGAQFALREADESLDARPVVSDGSHSMGALQAEQRSAEGGSAGAPSGASGPTLTKADFDEALRLLGERRLQIAVTLREDRLPIFLMSHVVSATDDSVAWTDVVGRRLFASAGGVLASVEPGGAVVDAGSGEQLLAMPDELEITMSQSPASMRELLTALSAACVSIEVRPLVQPLPTPSPSDPDDVLWWGADARHWSHLGAARVLLAH